MAPQKKITIAEAHEWIKNAISACTLEALESTEDLTQEFLDETRPVDFEEPKKPKKTKTSETKTSSSSSGSERSEEGYDADRCDARANKKEQGVRFDFQCSAKKLEGGCFCKNHQKKSDSSKGLELGKITDDRPTHWFSGDAISWHDADPELLAEKKTKKTKKLKKTEDGEKKPRKCSVCGEEGHNKRKCPQVTGESSSPEPSDEELEKDIIEACDDMILEIEKTEEIEKIEKTEEDDGTGTGLTLEPDFTVPVAETETPIAEVETLELPSPDTSESEEEEENVSFVYQEIAYECDSSGAVFSVDGDTIGNWDGEAVKWASDAERDAHNAKRSEMGEASPTLMDMEAKDLRKMARAISMSEDTIDEAWDSDDRKASLIELIENAPAFS